MNLPNHGYTRLKHARHTARHRWTVSGMSPELLECPPGAELPFEPLLESELRTHVSNT